MWFGASFLEGILLKFVEFVFLLPICRSTVATHVSSSPPFLPLPSSPNISSRVRMGHPSLPGRPSFLFAAALSAPLKKG
jgi:hypothetical protein